MDNIKTKINLVQRIAESLYAALVTMTQWPYVSGWMKPKPLSAKIISIGNITWGGTGKTPLTIMIADQLAQMGKKVVILTRGYGGDEEHELKNRLKGLPIIVGKDKLKSAKIAINKHNAEYIVLDDGFQHLRLPRDYDIVALNTTDPFGNGHMIPAGKLREPIPSLARANCIVLTQSFLGRHNIAWIKQHIRGVNPKAILFEADHQPIRFVDFRRNRPLPLDMVRGQKVAILSGVEDPLSFEKSIARLGARISYAARYPDHHDFSKNEMDEVFAACKDSRVRFLITTAKDSYRLNKVLKSDARFPTRILVLHIEMRMNDEEGFLKRCLRAKA